MNTPTNGGRSAYVQGMFARIARRYDLMNRLMTAGQDRRWRRVVIARAGLRPGDRLLDLGAGTGDLCREAARQQPGCQPVASDFTIEMMREGQNQKPVLTSWACADALRLPYPSRCFDALVSGFLLRNVTDLQAALKEQYRVLKPGGRMVALDTTRPTRNLLSPLIWVHMHVVIPLLGWVLSGQRDAYRYLPETSEAFLRAEELAARMAAAGFIKIGYRRMMFGTVAIHWGERGKTHSAK